MGRGGVQQLIAPTPARGKSSLPGTNLPFPEDGIIDSDYLGEDEANYDYQADHREQVVGTWGTNYYVPQSYSGKDETAKTVFTSGQCHAFALAVEEEIDGEICAFQDMEDDWFHLFVIKEGKFIDASGVYNSLKEFIKQEHNFGDKPCYKHNFRRNIDRQELEEKTANDDWCEKNITAARNYAQVVLQDLS